MPGLEDASGTRFQACAEGLGEGEAHDARESDGVNPTRDVDHDTRAKAVDQSRIRIPRRRPSPIDEELPRHDPSRPIR
jgi:hypothetical protein